MSLFEAFMGIVLFGAFANVFLENVIKDFMMRLILSGLIGYSVFAFCLHLSGKVIGGLL